MPPGHPFSRIPNPTVMDTLKRIARRSPLLVVALICSAILLGGASGCAGDPNVEGARLYLRQGDHDQALERANVALAANPDNADALWIKGEALRLRAEGQTQDAAARRGTYEEMVQAFNRAKAVNPALATEVNNRLRVAWATEMNAGVTFSNRIGTDPEAGNRAIDAFRNATLIQPDSAAGYLNLGFTMLRSDRAMEAAEPLAAAIERGEQSSDAYIYLGRIYRAQGRNDEALAVLEQARTRFPDDEEVQVELLNAYVGTGQTERALTAYRAAVDSEPDNPLFRYNYGSLLLQFSRYEEAIEQLRIAHDLEPDNAATLYNLGAAYQNRALAVNREIQEMENRRAPQREIDAAVDQRTELLRQSVPHLEESRRLTEAAGEDATSVCRALFQVYGQLGQLAQAQNAAECAGIDLN
jgi:tetratricopeptide (TPR) repeat protein